MSDPDPSTFNEFTILNAETRREKFEAARNIRLLKQEIESWKQKYEDIEPKYIEISAAYELLKQEIESWKQKYEDIRPKYIEISTKYEYSREVMARYRDQIAKDAATINSLNEEISTLSRLYLNSI